MLDCIWGHTARRWTVGAAALAITVAAVGSNARAEDAAAPPPEKSPYSVSLGFDFSSHYISYGLDTWGGGGQACPFNGDATHFAYGTVTCALTDNWSVFVNVWSDLNDNAESQIGGTVQEIDLNTGVSYAIDKWSFSLANGLWNYGGGTEQVIDFNAGYNDADMLAKGFAFNPSVNVHWRYREGPGQTQGVAIVPGIKPSYTIFSDTKYPLTLAVPVNVAFFASDKFQGGDSGYGYFSAGLSASMPLTFIPERYGAWAVTASATYYNTSDDAIPGNPEDNFVVTDLGVGVSF